MQFGFSYDKKKTIQALRYHFISKSEIKTMLILINVFAITTAVLYYAKKIRPEPFLLGSTIWVLMMVAIWYLLPNSIYKKAATFKDSFIINFSDNQIELSNERGETVWQWNQFTKFIESPHFFHLYFDAKSFFLVPKETIGMEMQHELRGLLNKKIGK